MAVKRSNFIHRSTLFLIMTQTNGISLIQDLIHRVIQSCSTVLKEVVREIIWSKKCKYIFYGFATVSKLLRFYICVAFIIVIIDFYKKETACFNVVCQLSSLFPIDERNCVFVSVYLPLRSTQF
jgi:hypothetical protein